MSTNCAFGFTRDRVLTIHGKHSKERAMTVGCLGYLELEIRGSDSIQLFIYSINGAGNMKMSDIDDHVKRQLTQPCGAAWN